MKNMLHFSMLSGIAQKPMGRALDSQWEKLRCEIWGALQDWVVSDYL